MTIKKGVSIILCTYNGKHLLEETLKYIIAQKLTTPCEIILVDNASTDGTKVFADNWWDSHNLNTSIEYYSYIQPIQGKSYAQALGYDRAKYAYLLICDDDNWLCETYVQNAFDIMESQSYIGALGGWCEAVFENDKPNWFEHHSQSYAVGIQAQSNGDITEFVGYLYGAGMVIRTAHWQELKSLGFEHLLSCRKGDSLSSGGDTEYCYALQLLGYKIWYDDTLYFKHYMTSGRLNLFYLSRLRKAMAYSNFVISAYRDVLYGVVINKNLLFKRIVIQLRKGLLKNTYRRLFGNYEQRELGKNYFRKLNYMCFHQRTYFNHISFIKSWLVKTKTAHKELN